MSSSPPAADISVGLQKVQTFCLVVLAAIGIGLALFWLKSVLLPFVIAMFFVSGVRPILDYLEGRWRLHWFVAFLITFAVGGMLVILFAVVTWLSIADLAHNSTAYNRRVRDILAWVNEHLTDENEGLEGPPENGPAAEPPMVIPELDYYGEDPRPTNAASPEVPEDRIAPAIPPPRPSAPNKPYNWAVTTFLNYLAARSQTAARDLASALTNLMSSTVLVLIIVFFLLLDRATPTRKSSRVFKMIDLQIREYIVMKTMISVATGVAFGLVLWLFGVQLAILFGMMAFLLNYIPNIGPIIASFLPLPFLILNPETSFWMGGLIFGLGALVQFVSGSVIEPKMMGTSFNVHPVVLLLSLMLFGLIWGIMGMFLATPITSALRIIFDQNPRTRAIASLMAGDLESLDTAANPHV